MLSTSSLLIRFLFAGSHFSISSCVSDHAERVYFALPPASALPAILHHVPAQSFETIADIQWVGGAPGIDGIRQAGERVLMELGNGDGFIDPIGAWDHGGAKGIAPVGSLQETVGLLTLSE